MASLLVAKLTTAPVVLTTESLVEKGDVVSEDSETTPIESELEQLGILRSKDPSGKIIDFYLKKKGAEIPNHFDRRSLVCQVSNIWHEARGEVKEGRTGYKLVAQTVMNRYDSAEGGLDICGVIYYPGAFSWTKDGISDAIVVKSKLDVINLYHAVEIAVRSFDGEYKGMVYGATQYYNPEKVTPCWESSYNSFFNYGNHRWGLEPNGKTPCWDSKIAKLELAKSKKREG